MNYRGKANRQINHQFKVLKNAPKQFTTAFQNQLLKKIQCQPNVKTSLFSFIDQTLSTSVPPGLLPQIITSTERDQFLTQDQVKNLISRFIAEYLQPKTIGLQPTPTVNEFRLNIIEDYFYQQCIDYSQFQLGTTPQKLADTARPISKFQQFVAKIKSFAGKQPAREESESDQSTNLDTVSDNTESEFQMSLARTPVPMLLSKTNSVELKKDKKFLPKMQKLQSECIPAAKSDLSQPANLIRDYYKRQNSSLNSLQTGSINRKEN